MLTRRKFIQTSVAAGTLFGLGASHPLSFSHAKVKGSASFDVLIKNGVIYSGDGRSPIPGDIGIKDGKIAAIGNLGETADQVLDVNGCAVSPGFIDIHSHTDTNLLQCPAGDSKLYQGVTTELGGSCGSGPFPLSDENYAQQKDTLRFGYPAWQNADGFFDALEKNKIGINYASSTGQGRLRSIAIGNYAVPSTRDQLKQMKDILIKQLDMGSMGMSSGLEYTPGSYASTEELVELCKVVAEYNGLFSIHMRNENDFVEEALQESIEIARLSGVRIQIAHLKAANTPNWHKVPKLLKMIDNAVASGVDIAFDRYSYLAFSTGLSQFIPVQDRQGTSAESVARLNDPTKIGEIRRFAAAKLQGTGGPKNVLITSCRHADNLQYRGKTLQEGAEMAKMEALDFLFYLLKSENIGGNYFGFAMSEENLQLLYAHRLSMPGSDGSVVSPQGPLSAGRAHPRSYGTFTRFLGTYVRERKVVDLQTAIFKMTALPASRMGLKNRGLLIPGYQADVVVFNPETVKELATYTDPHQFGEGIEHVFVNGVWTIKNAKHTGALAGSVLRLC